MEHWQFLWEIKAIQEMFAIRNEICVPDSTEYFFNHLQRVTKDEYVPTDKDILMVYHVTRGIIHLKMTNICTATLNLFLSRHGTKEIYHKGSKIQHFGHWWAPM